MIARSSLSFLSLSCCSFSSFFFLLSSFSSSIRFCSSSLLAGFDILFLYYNRSIRMISWVGTKRSHLTLRLTFFRAYEKYKQDILRSQFHKQGHQHFLKSKWMNRNINNNIIQIDKVLLDLQKLRLPLLETTAASFSNQLIASLPQDSQSQKYFKTYIKLLELIGESNFNEEWYYQIVGWYNLQPFLGEVCEKLFSYKTKNQHLLLVESISWMDPHLFMADLRQQLYELKKQQKMIEDYYKRLNLSHPISFLQKVQTILRNTSNSYKSKFYCKYIETNLQKILKKINLVNKQQIDDLFWFIKAYFETHNDKSSVLNLFEEFLLKQRIELSQANLEILMGIYGQIGNMNPKVYETYIRQPIHSSLSGPIEKIVNTLQFVIQSQIDDSDTLNLLLKKIALSQKETQIDDYLKHQVHYLLHYLSIKGTKYQLSVQFHKKLSQCCRDYEGNGEIARMMAIQLDQKARKEGKQYFSSECLRRNRLNAAIKQDKPQNIKNLPEQYKKYQNVRFCTININTCILNSETKQMVILQREFARFKPSGKIGRKQEIRDTILKHYGFKVNYMEAKEYTKQIARTEEQEQ